VVGLWGARAPEVLEAVAGDGSAGACAPMHAATLPIGPSTVEVLGVCYAGGPGYELWVDPSWAVAIWDRLLAAGDTCGIAPVGYRAIDSLRIEAGYRALGTDLSGTDTPWAAGLGAFVALEGRSFVGRDALAAHRDRDTRTRLRTIAIGDGAWQPAYGGEAIRSGGEVVGRVRSAAYGYTVGRMLATAYLPTSMDEGAEIEVDLFGRPAPASVVADAPLRMMKGGAA